MKEPSASLRRTFDRQKCRQRNSIAAKRDGIDAVPLRFLRQVAENTAPTTARGRLPQTTEAAMERINALRPGQEPLSAEDVYIHYLEAANGNFIPDRWMFMGRSTLRNIQEDADAGFAFMNSHRTGGLSHPSDLPMGRTFAGRYELYRDGDEQLERSVVGVYMLRGQSPNGPAGPSTDDIHAGIEGGTIFDCSVGLYGGHSVCDVCGNDLDAYDREEGGWLCPHAPGTTRKMTAEQQEAQKARGVPGGEATYSLVDARPGEVSAVFDGAVPGAGFRKVLALSREGRLGRAETAQARGAYARLLAKGDLSMGLEEAIEATLRRFGFRPRSEDYSEPGTAGSRIYAPNGEERPPSAPAVYLEPARTADPELERKNQELAARVVEQDRQIRDERLKRIQGEAEAFASSLKDRIVPAERGPLIALYCDLAEQDESGPGQLSFQVAGQERQLSRLETLKSLYSQRPKHMLLEETIPADWTVKYPPAEHGEATMSDQIVANLRRMGPDGKPTPDIATQVQDALARFVTANGRDSK